MITREQPLVVILPAGIVSDGETITAVVERASPKKVTIRLTPDDHDAFPLEFRVDGITCSLEDHPFLFDGIVRKIGRPCVEITLIDLDKDSQIFYNNFLLERLDKQFELSRKVEEIALEEIQQLNRELSLSLQVEEAALAEAQQVNEELLIAQKELLTSRNQLEAILNAITEGIYLISARFELLALNKQQMKRVVSGTGKSKVLGKKCYQVFFNRDQPCLHCTAVTTFSSGNPARETVSIRPLDDMIHLEYYSFPVQSDSGTVHQVVQYVQDVTQKRDMEEQLFQTEKMAALGTMTAGIAHELRNPLSSISMTIQLLKQKQELTENIKKKLDKIELQVNKAGKIVSDVKTFSRREQFELHPMDVSTLVENLLLQLGEVGMLKHIDLVKDLSCHSLSLIEKDQLEQVLINLIQNALDAMEGRERQQLRIATGLVNPDLACISIEDSGEGIDEAKMKKIFDPFFTTKPPGRGTGLGLALSYKIIERHRGSIKVRSNPGEGTIFTVTLPVHHSS